MSSGGPCSVASVLIDVQRQRVGRVSALTPPTQNLLLCLGGPCDDAEGEKNRADDRRQVRKLGYVPQPDQCTLRNPDATQLPRRRDRARSAGCEDRGLSPS